MFEGIKKFLFSAKVVGVTSSEGFLVSRLVINANAAGRRTVVMCC